MKKVIYFVFVMILSAVSVFGQQFGKNKVQYQQKNWFYIQTKHFDIYFTDKGERSAEFTAQSAEDAITEIQDDLDYKVNNRISLIVYDSHNEFQETNTSDAFNSQGVGGFTEPFKNRVVIPFEGSFEKFDHVIHHELVHAVMRDMLYGGTVQNIVAKNITLQLPGWVHEGMAEFLSSGWETNSDQFIRDAIINEYLPNINQLSGYFAYRGGQSVFYYISHKYGRQKVGELLQKIKSTNGLESGMKAAIGLDVKELSEDWKKFIKKRYWPEIDIYKDPEEFAKRLTDNSEVGGFYNTSPAISPQGDKIAFISDRDIFIDVYVMNANDGKIISKVVESGNTNDFEELNLLFPSLTWAPDNKRIALSTKSGGYDVITVINVETDDNEALPFKMDGIESVNWSPDGSKIAFVGQTPEQSDVYIYNFDDGALYNVTNDIFSEQDPSWSPDNKKIFFSSDRGSIVESDTVSRDFNMYIHNFKHLDLYSIDVDSKKVTRLTNWKLSDEQYAVVSEDGKEMLFVSDYNGINNIYKKRIELTSKDTVKSIADIPAVPITNSLSEISQLSLSSDAKKLTFTSLYDGGYNVYLLNNPFDVKIDQQKLRFTDYMKWLRSPHKRTYAKSDTANSEQEETLAVETVQDTSSVTKDSSSTFFTGQYVSNPDTTKNDSSEDYSKFVFGGDNIPTDSTLAKSKEDLFEAKLDTNGNYLVNRYKVNFTPDLVYANAGYSTLYGLLGTTVLAFSDLLGNHRLIGTTSLQIDLKNSDYGLAYYYLKQRINYGVEAFHTARFVYVTRRGFSELYRFRNFGGVVSASLPLSRFRRVEGSLSLLSVSAENLDRANAPSEKSTYLIPSLSYVYDNVLWGYTSPIQGTRYNVTAFGNPGFNNKSQSFYSVVWDYRRYFRFWFDNLFVFRISGGYSGGGNPQRFILGGTDNWINRSFATGNVPLDNVSDFAFLTPALPLRGYDYAQQIGNKYSLLNLELRMPLIRYLVTGPIPLFIQNILGTAFIDMGTAWNNNEQLKLFGKNQFGDTVTQDLLVGTGVGLRVYLIFLWRFDVAWKYNYQSFSKPRYYISIGYDF